MYNPPSLGQRESISGERDSGERSRNLNHHFQSDGNVSAPIFSPVTSSEKFIKDPPPGPLHPVPIQHSVGPPPSRPEEGSGSLLPGATQRGDVHSVKEAIARV